MGEEVASIIASPRLTPINQLEEAVDFHCSELVPHIISFLRARGDLHTQADDVRNAVWVCRSSVNVRDHEAPGRQRLTPSWWDAQLNTAISAFSQNAWTMSASPPA